MLVLLLFLVVPLVVWYISVSNELKRDIVKIDEASSDIDVALTKRYDVLTKMIEVVKGYVKHEKETMFGTIELRQGMTMREKALVSEKIEENLFRINALAENYPDLKANENFKVLQQAIADTEEHLQASRRLYNAKVSSFNQKVVTFPTSIVSEMSGLTKREFFKTEDIKREDVKISF